jgi:hypothetical protein
MISEEIHPGKSYREMYRGEREMISRNDVKEGVRVTVRGEYYTHTFILTQNKLDFSLYGKLSCNSVAKELKN